MSRKRYKRGGPKFIQIYHATMNTEAWISLSHGARALYQELVRLHNGHNNGRIMLSHRMAAERLGCSKNCITGYYRALEDRGFIRKTELHRLTVASKGANS